MPLVSLGQTSPLIDGRQSENAMLVRRGVQRLFLELGLAVMPELPLASGRRADLVALTRSGEIWIVEIKSSIEDWRVDREMADLSRALRPAVLRHASGCSGGHFPR